MKTIKSMALLFTLLFLCACTQNYTNWVSNNILNETFLLPKEWVLTTKDNRVYITDKPLGEADCKPYFIQTNSFANSVDNEAGIVDSNLFYSQIQAILTVESNGLSNGVGYGKALIRIDRKRKEVFFISFPANLHFFHGMILLPKSL